MVRRTIIAACVLLFLVLLLAALWAGFDWPPPRLILKYGFPPTGGPTGRTMTIEGVEFVELKPGYFRMGSHFMCQKGDLLGRVCARLGIPWGKQPNHDRYECPPHWVEITRDFWIARTETTNTQYERYAPKHERDWLAGDHPVTSVSLEDAQAYCDWLAGRSGLRVRLPSEAEWEYACRAGSATEYCFGDNVTELSEYAWFADNSDGHVHEVRLLKPNGWGCHDFHGNVSEWCEDKWHKNYSGAPDDGSTWLTGSSPSRVYRGCDYRYGGAACRSAFRFGANRGERFTVVGLRLALGEE